MDARGADGNWESVGVLSGPVSIGIEPSDGVREERSFGDPLQVEFTVEVSHIADLLGGMTAMLPQSGSGPSLIVERRVRRTRYRTVREYKRERKGCRRRGRRRGASWFGVERKTFCNVRIEPNLSAGTENVIAITAQPLSPGICELLGDGGEGSDFVRVDG